MCSAGVVLCLAWTPVTVILRQGRQGLLQLLLGRIFGPTLKENRKTKFLARADPFFFGLDTM